MERRAPVSRMERAVRSVVVRTEGEGMRALCWRRASFARESWGRVEAGSAWWWSACWRECRVWSREGEVAEWWERGEVADGMLSWNLGVVCKGGERVTVLND